MSSSPASPASHAPVKEGDILASKYRVEKVLGVGGMGVVVAAEHIELSQKVALKFLLKQAAANDDLVGRFLREARASVRLKGAHVAKTLDVGRLEDGAPYIVMEFLDGHDLHAEIRNAASAGGALAIVDAVSYVVQAAEGLAEAHSLGIVHRDLKPGNLFLTRGVDGRPLVKVLDFGISKTMDPSVGGDGLSLTNTSMLLGSPLYMSPEQMRSSKHVDERSDLWALGAIAFELLTGRVPFEAETILELCFKVAQEKAPNPKSLRADLPDALCEAVVKCLEKDPADRFANVGELARAFEPFALERDRGTGERALDVLGTGKRPPMRSIPVITSAAPTPPATPAPAVSGPTPLPDAAPGVAQLAPASSSQAEAVAPAAWGTTQAQNTTKTRKGMVAIGGAVVVIAALAGTIVASSRKTPDGVAAAGSAMPANASANANANGGGDASGSAAPGAADAGTVLMTSDGPATRPAGATTAVVKGAGRSTMPALVSSGGAAKGGKPAGAASGATSAGAAAPGGAPTAEPGGFIKVRE